MAGFTLNPAGPLFLKRSQKSQTLIKGRLTYNEKCSSPKVTCTLSLSHSFFSTHLSLAPSPFQALSKVHNKSTKVLHHPDHFPRTLSIGIRAVRVQKQSTQVAGQQRKSVLSRIIPLLTRRPSSFLSKTLKTVKIRAVFALK